MTHWNIQFSHDINALDRQPRRGRNPFEGYLRGCGLEFGNLPQLCSADPDFQSALRLTTDKTVIHPIRFMNMFLLLKMFVPNLSRGHIVEFGSYLGGSAMFLACLAKRLLPGCQVWGFDTFEGMPPTDRGIDIHKTGDFRDTDLPALVAETDRLGLDNLHFVKGRFEQTWPATRDQIGPVCLAHIDCDVYSGVSYSYDAVKSSMVKGGYIIFDDPNVSTCLGAQEAVEELVIRRDGLHAEQVAPHMVFRYPPIDSEPEK